MSPMTTKMATSSSTEEFNYHTDMWEPSSTRYVNGIVQHDTANNGWPRRRGADIGSPWTNIQTVFSGGLSYFHGWTKFPYSGGIWHGYNGPVWVDDSANFESESFEDMLGGSSELDLLGFGTTAISRCAPTSPVSDVPTAVGELLSEGLPSTIGTSIRRGGRVSPGTVSGEYLNYTFGLEPFFRDISSFIDASRNANRILEQYRRDSGKLIRRRYEAEPSQTTNTITYDPEDGYRYRQLGPLGHSSIGGYCSPVLGGYGGERTDIETTSIQKWFSGAFTYYLPKIGMGDLAELQRGYAEMRHLYGGISASTAWNLIPFSWAADWFTNAGDLIKNIDMFVQDGLVMPYGYVMEKYTFTSHRTVVGARLGNLYHDSDQLPSTLTSTFGVKYQRRRKATPFGFGLDPLSFTARQWSIIGALGLNRVF